MPKIKSHSSSRAPNLKVLEEFKKKSVKINYLKSPTYKTNFINSITKEDFNKIIKMEDLLLEMIRYRNMTDFFKITLLKTACTIDQRLFELYMSNYEGLFIKDEYEVKYIDRYGMTIVEEIAYHFKFLNLPTLNNKNVVLHSLS